MAIPTRFSIDYPQRCLELVSQLEEYAREQHLVGSFALLAASSVLTIPFERARAKHFLHRDKDNPLTEAIKSLGRVCLPEKITAGRNPDAAMSSCSTPLAQSDSRCPRFSESDRSSATQEKKFLVDSITSPSPNFQCARTPFSGASGSASGAAFQNSSRMVPVGRVGNTTRVPPRRTYSRMVCWVRSESRNWDLSGSKTGRKTTASRRSCSTG